MNSKAAERDDISGIRQIGDAIIRRAARIKSSKIHIVPQQDCSLVRFHIEDEFSSPVRIPIALHKQVISYIKHLAAENGDGIAQGTDAVFPVKIKDNRYFLKVETCPTEFGDSIIIHISHRHSINVGIASTGLSGFLRNKVCEAIEGKSGVVILSGPFDSGKTASMYAFLNHLSQQGKKVLTVENEIDMELPNIIQLTTQGANSDLLLNTKIQERIRQEDPDVIMLYHLNDAETAQAAFDMARHGRMVLAGLGSNDAAATVIQLRKLGVHELLISEELKLILNQRLLRQLCPHCRDEVSPTADLLARFNLATDTKVYKSVGCHTCMHTGYSGRLPVHEAMVITEDIATMIRNGVSEIDLRRANREGGMFSLFEDGMSKALSGKLSLEDVLRDLPKPSHEKSIGNRLQDGRLQSPAAIIPLARPQAVSTPVTPVASAATLPPASALESNNKPTLLLVEDSHTMRDYIGYILRNGGNYDVVDVGTAEEALSILFQDRPSMIVTDQILPGMNGTSLIATVRSNAKMADIPIVLLTSGTKMEIEALKIGADSYIEKPIDPELLLARVGAIFSAYKRMRSR